MIMVDYSWLQLMILNINSFLYIDIYIYIRVCWQKQNVFFCFGTLIFYCILMCRFQKWPHIIKLILGSWLKMHLKNGTFLHFCIIFSKVVIWPNIHFLLTKSNLTPPYFFNFKSWRNKSGLRILIFQVNSGFMGHFWYLKK